jgi:hypothetical protein
MVVGLAVASAVRRRADLLPPFLLVLGIAPPALLLLFSTFRVIPAGHVGVCRRCTSRWC